ncbi:tyrosine-tRNA ligase [Gigaspora rosea]|uniref:Tyrosine--tRNA ligase n=1 Tax=Gigaspora rosea TaxID=44941 RepID=A0A397U4T7_9GLOM|nr:tyrosine-tRNA ligase [Gigaspora rosea]
MVNELTSSDIIDHVKKQTAVYCGVDPTASSLHLGNLLTLMGLLHFNIIGHRTIVLIGGATGIIGDPSGRNTERQPLSVTTIEHNVTVLNQQLRHIFNNGLMYASRRGIALGNNLDNFSVMNNLEWFHKMTALEMLNDIGRHFRVGQMLMKDSVKLRMENEGGISFTEFSYQLLQAYDFWYLYNHHQCRIQLGGSDQWGNITAGIDLIHKKKNRDLIDDKNIKEKFGNAFGITIPLLVTSTGEKFGKSTGNAIWLNENLTSVYEFYQYFMKVADADVEKYLLMFTLLSTEEITQVIKTHMESPEKHYAQEKLASEITELVHGLQGLKKAQFATSVLFDTPIKDMSGRDIIDAFANYSRCLSTVKRNDVINCSIDRVAVVTGACKSRSEANKLIKSGGLYLNSKRIGDPQYQLQENDLIDGIVCIFRIGRSNYRLAQIVD